MDLKWLYFFPKCIVIFQYFLAFSKYSDIFVAIFQQVIGEKLINSISHYMFSIEA